MLFCGSKQPEARANLGSKAMSGNRYQIRQLQSSGELGQLIAELFDFNLGSAVQHLFTAQGEINNDTTFNLEVAREFIDREIAKRQSNAPSLAVAGENVIQMPAENNIEDFSEIFERKDAAPDYEKKNRSILKTPSRT